VYYGKSNPENFIARGWHTGTHRQSLSQRSRPLESCQFNGQGSKPPAHNRNFVVKSTLKGQKGLLVKGQIEISASQDFDSGRRSPYSAYLHDTPLYSSVILYCIVPIHIVHYSTKRKMMGSRANVKWLLQAEGTLRHMHCLVVRID